MTVWFAGVGIEEFKQWDGRDLTCNVNGERTSTLSYSQLTASQSTLFC